MALTNKEQMIWDEVYSKTYDEVRNEEYADMMAVNPEHLEDKVRSFATEYAKDMAREVASKAIMDLRESDDA